MSYVPTPAVLEDPLPRLVARALLPRLTGVGLKRYKRAKYVTSVIYSVGRASRYRLDGMGWGWGGMDGHGMGRDVDL